METLVYLDQNTLSDLRPRRLNESNSQVLCSIYEVFRKRKARLLYSHVHLSEIKQIGKPEYQDEHIQLLEKLDAIYIEPLFKKLNFSSAIEIFESYKETCKTNKTLGIDNFVLDFDNIGRKLSGLPIHGCFDELHQSLRFSLGELLNTCQNIMQHMNISELDEYEKEWFQSLKSQIPGLKTRANLMQPLNIESGQEVGPKPFRDLLARKGIDIENLSSILVIPELEALFLSETGNKFDWSHYFEDSVENRVVRCYQLMNWAGYHPDDFTKVKKRKDRYRASTNDMMHASFAAFCHFLVSQDYAFRKKAEACYSYLKLSPRVTNPEQFVEYFVDNNPTEPAS